MWTPASRYRANDSIAMPLRPNTHGQWATVAPLSASKLKVAIVGVGEPAVAAGEEAVPDDEVSSQETHVGEEANRRAAVPAEHLLELDHGLAGVDLHGNIELLRDLGGALEELRPARVNLRRRQERPDEVAVAPVVPTNEVDGSRESLLLDLGARPVVSDHSVVLDGPRGGAIHLADVRSQPDRRCKFDGLLDHRVADLDDRRGAGRITSRNE